MIGAAKNIYGQTPIDLVLKNDADLKLFGLADFSTCSFARTKDTATEQVFYECLDCGLVDTEGCCDVCAARFVSACLKVIEDRL